MPTPPLKYRMGSAVPWKARMGTRRVVRHGVGICRPETAATAVNRLDMVQASSDTMNDPSDRPLA